MISLHKDLVQKLIEYRKIRNFQPEKWLSKKIKLLNDYMKTNGLKSCCISLSGGVDSAVSLAIVKKAQEESDSPIKRVVAIAQPIHSSDWALQRAKECAKSLDCEMIVIDQSDFHTLLKKKIDEEIGISGSSYSSGQLRSYLRTPAGYYVSQLLSQSGYPCIVIGTGNQDEDGYLAYFCKAGDGVVDVQLISDLHKSEVFEVGKALKIPSSILQAKPSADLWDGQSDEEELGFSYDFVELFTGYYLKLNDEEKQNFQQSLSNEAKIQFKLCCEMAVKVHLRNLHKLNFPIQLNN